VLLSHRVSKSDLGSQLPSVGSDNPFVVVALVEATLDPQTGIAPQLADLNPYPLLSL
jgi:hypothetical protein